MMTHAAPIALSSAFHVRVSQNATCGRSDGMSPRKFSQKSQALTYRQHFAARWSGFIRDNFESPEHAAMVFGVDGSTAKKWWLGSHAPSGFAVGYAYERFGEQALDSLKANP